MPAKDTPKKGDQMPNKKLLTPDKTAEPPVKKLCTSSPSSERENETDNDRAGKHKEKKKKKKKKEVKSEPTVVTESEVEETEEQQEKCQWARKWKQELQVYRESHNIFLNAFPEWNGGSHMGYLESCLSDSNPGFFFIQSIKEWRTELQKQSLGIGHSVSTTHHKLKTLERMSEVKLLNRMACVPNTWSRYSSILGLGTTFQQMPKTGMA